MAENERTSLAVADRSPIFAGAVCEELGKAFGEDKLVCEIVDCEDTDLLSNPRWDGILLDPLFTPSLGQIAPKMLESRPNIAMVAIASQPSRELVQYCFEIGFKAVVSKAIPLSALLRVVRITLAGGSFVERDLARDPVAAPPGRTEGRTMTEREEAVLRRWAQGYSNGEIARQEGLSPKTVDTYRARGMEKLGLHDRPSVIRMASARGWLT